MLWNVGCGMNNERVMIINLSNTTYSMSVHARMMMNDKIE